jgi:hypothetical protein
MTFDENEFFDTRQWVLTWKSAARELDKIKEKELAELDTTVALNNLSQAFDFAMKNAVPRPSSGLVEQQFYFKKLRENEKNI